MNKPTSGISIIVPVHNEQACVVPTIHAILHVLRDSDHDFELIVVDDGSTDNTPQLLDGVTGCRVLRHETCRGYGAALKTGISKARHAMIGILDADGTYPAGDLPRLMRRMHSADMVIGARVDVPKSQWLRQFVKWFMTRLAELLIGGRIPDLNSGMRVFNKRLAQRHMGLLPDGFSFTTTITVATLAEEGRVEFIPISYHDRIGRSKIRPIRDTLNMARTIVRTTLVCAPAKIAIPVTTLCSVLLALSLSGSIFYVEGITNKVLFMVVNLIQLLLVFMTIDLVRRRMAMRNVWGSGNTNEELP